jgi:hypothetical protein
MKTKMTTTMTKRLARAVLIAGLALPATALLPASAPFAISEARAASPATKAETLAEFRAVLANYGTFGTHEKYDEIWVPTVTPQGWHPYPPCQWVYTKDGWYFNDDTPWGSIVHHYGRWSHDEKIGWFWVPDEDWSPGWVVWRKSDKWVGWAPMPPEQDAQLVSSAEFNNDKLWIFMEAQKFFNGGCGTIVQGPQVSQVFYETQYVTLFDLPPGLLVEVIFVPKWKIKVITKFLIVEKVCPPSNNPQKPPQALRRSDLSPPVRLDNPKPTKPRLSIDLPPRRGVFSKPEIAIKGGATNGRGGSGGATLKPTIGLVHPSGQKPTILNRFHPNLATNGQHGRNTVR